MITDAQTRFSNAQAVTTGTQLSTNSYDMVLARDIGRGRNIRVIVTIDTTFTGGTSLQVNIVESVNSDLSSSSAILTGPVTAEAALLAGTKLMDQVLPQTSKRYVGLQFVTVGTHGAGALTGGLVLDTDSGTYFAANTGF
jgi:hypothetical protein